MKLFRVDENKELETADTPALRLYNKVSDIEGDIANIPPGTLVGNIQSSTPTEDFQSFLDFVARVIPAGTSEGNMLVNQSQVPDVEPAFDEIRGRLDTIEDELPNKADKNDLNQLAARVGVNETNIANLSDQVTNVETSVAELADCPGLNCTGTLTEEDIADFTSCKGTVTGIYDKVGNTTFYPNDDGIVTVELASGGGDSLPAGTVIPYAGATTPNGWLPCNGQEVSRDEYPALFEAIGTTYGAGDGTTTFRLPDYREAALVGIGQRASGVATHDEYTLGQFKDDQLQDHKHYRWSNGYNGWARGVVIGDTLSFSQNTTDNNNSSPTGQVTPDSLSVRVGSTTHGKRIGVNYIIKWTRQGSSEDQNDIDSIVRNRVMAALSKANEDLYKNISITTVSTGITAWGQTYTIQNDGLYLIRVGFITATTGGNVVIRIDGSDRGFKPCGQTGSFEYTATYQLKKGNVVSTRFDSTGTTFNGFTLIYMGRLDLTAGFSGDDWDWGGGTGGSGLTEEEVKDLIKEANEPVQINTIEFDTSYGVTATANSIEAYRSGNTVTVTFNNLKLTGVPSSSSSTRFIKGLPRPTQRMFIQISNVRDFSNKVSGYVSIDTNGNLVTDTGFNSVGDTAWFSATYITKDE